MKYGEMKSTYRRSRGNGRRIKRELIDILKKLEIFEYDGTLYWTVYKKRSG